MDDDLKAELQETRRMHNLRITRLRVGMILGQVIFVGALAMAIVTWFLDIGPGVLTIIALLAGFAITLRALLLQLVVVNSMTMLNVTEKLETIEELLKEKWKL